MRIEASLMSVIGAEAFPCLDVTAKHKDLSAAPAP